MKASMILKPLAFAMAAVLATSAYAGKPPPHHPGPTTSASGSSATVDDTQLNYDNEVTNNETKNTAAIDTSLNGVSGNVGANVASGDNNQQANAAAIATADAGFVFGLGSQGYSAQASITVEQQGHDNTLTNNGNPNNASVTNSGWEAQGNVGINVAAGNFNQQKNDLAIASSETAYKAEASVTVLQESHDNVTENNVGDVYELDGGLDVVAASRSNPRNPPHNPPGNPSEDPTSVPQTPVVNNATLYNSLNDASGNVGINIAAGGGNQQSNSLAIAAGCSACPSGL
jgi:hypothetical protein